MKKLVTLLLMLMLLSSLLACGKKGPPVLPQYDKEPEKRQEKL
jgi:predicted small lipoprotein YifL